jgi:tRNA pseudouridine55 synthase
VHGVILVDKPSGLSSSTVVQDVRRALRVKRAGHGGTLDPMATGLLAVCLGAGTKLAPYLLADDKAYEAEAELGIETDTLDRTGHVLTARDVPTDGLRERLEAVLRARTGPQTQVPPMFSAIKQGGVPLYELARAGEEVERASRQIRIDRLELVAFAPPRFSVAIECSKGTYVRSLLADIGADLGLGAHLTALRRTRAGRFSLADATPLDEILRTRSARVIAPADATLFPRCPVPPEHLQVVLRGVQVAVEAWGLDSSGPLPAQFQLVDARGQLLAICHAENGKTFYDRVFPELFP